MNLDQAPAVLARLKAKLETATTPRARLGLVFRIALLEDAMKAQRGG